MRDSFADKGSLVVRPDEEGVRRRQAEYVFLTTLNRTGPSKKRFMKNRMKNRVKEISEAGEPLMYFDATTSSVEHQPREFNEILDRCLRRGWIKRTADGEYKTTKKGSERITELKHTDSYEINGNLQ